MKTTCKACGAAFNSPPSRSSAACSIPCRDIIKRRAVYDDAADKKRCASCREWLPFASFDGTSGVKASKQVVALQANCGPCASLTNKQWRAANRPAQPKTEPLLDKRTRKNMLRCEWARRNHETVLMWNRIRRHRERTAGLMPSISDFKAMGCMQDWRCTYCQESLKSFHIDHKMPVSRGGLNGEKNLQLLCGPCNLKKGVMTHDEYAARIGWQEPPEPPPAPFDVDAYVHAMDRGDVRGAIRILRGAHNPYADRPAGQPQLLAVTLEQLETGR